MVAGKFNTTGGVYVTLILGSPRRYMGLNYNAVHGGVTGSNGVRLLNGTLFGHIVQTYSLVRLRYLIGEAARKPPVLTGGGIASLTFCTYHLYSAVLGYTLRSLLPIRDRQYRYSKMVTTGDHTSKHHAILDVRRTTV